VGLAALGLPADQQDLRRAGVGPQLTQPVPKRLPVEHEHIGADDAGADQGFGRPHLLNRLGQRAQVSLGRDHLDKPGQQARLGQLLEGLLPDPVGTRLQVQRAQVLRTSCTGVR
jgi:hypothetical protein